MVTGVSAPLLPSLPPLTAPAKTDCTMEAAAGDGLKSPEQVRTLSSHHTLQRHVPSPHSFPSQLVAATVPTIPVTKLVKETNHCC